MTELQRITLKEFTGGLNLRQSNFNLGDDESPDMLNVEIDPRGGFYSRRGWQRWNPIDITTPASWAPRNGCIHPLSDGDFLAYVANDGDLYQGVSTGAFVDTLVPVAAESHLADFASWGDILYVACGRTTFSYSITNGATPVELGDSFAGYNNDYTVPTGGRMPKCDHVEAHTGYLFCASIYEDGADHPNRLRWSHPTRVEDWAELDFIDIEAGGGAITALVSFQDHLLIFKTESIWALYGYDSESWQLVRVSRSAGAPSPTAVSASENVVFFYSSASRSGVYAYAGGQEVAHLTEKLRTAMEETEAPQDVWLGWVGRRLWCSIPWRPERSTGHCHSAFVFDPEVGNGAWVRHEAPIGDLTLIIHGSDSAVGYPLAAISGSSGAAALVQLDYSLAAEDVIRLADEATPFTSRYRTGWKDAGFPERLKSWRRPRLILRAPSATASLLVECFHDYDTATVARSSQNIIPGPEGGGLVWRDAGAAAVEGDGWDWDDGTFWPSDPSGSLIQRGQPFGHSRAMQLRFTVTPSSLGTSWGVDLVELKYIYRRFTT